MNDQFFMRRAISLAKRGYGKTSPNPCVGAVIVKNGKIISEGFHHGFSYPHAEIEALKNINANNATMYVTLEPCSPNAKNRSCAEAIVKNGIARVVIASIDPNPLVNGKGISFLLKSGITVEVGMLEKKAILLNQPFFKNMTKGLPYVTAKIAMSLDGKIATVTGDSRGLSSSASLREVHRLRSRHDAIAVGLGTVMRDDPELTVRHVKGKNPIKVIFGARKRLPPDMKIFQSGKTIFLFPSDDIKEALRWLYKEHKITSLLLEGGEKLLTSFFEADAIDRYITFIVPKLLGGETAKTPLRGKGIDAIKAAKQLSHVKIKTFQADSVTKDLMVDGFLKVYEPKVFDTRKHEAVKNKAVSRQQSRGRLSITTS